MGLTDEQKEIKKEFASYKRKVTEIAGVMHDIVEDTIWTEYDRLPELAENIQVAMKDVVDFREKHDFLK
jgi:NADH:ubiquinone oxidoreductase subunit E